MSDKPKLVIVVTNGFDNERSSVAWSVASGGIKTGFDVTIFLVSSGVDWVRKGSAEHARLNPYDPPVGEMMKTAMDAGATIMVCPPCSKARGYEETDFIDGVIITGSPAMLEIVKQGAATLSF